MTAIRVCYQWDTGFIVDSRQLQQRKGTRNRMTIYAKNKLRTPEEIGQFEAESYFSAGNFDQELLANVIAQSIRAYVANYAAATTPPSETAVGGEAWTSVDNWPVDSVLGHLADATEHLLSDHECDCCGWETWKYATEAARKHVALLTTPDDDLPVCLKCKHFENLYPRGRCLSTYRDAAGSLVYCACKCEFAAPVHAAGDDEGEWCDDCRAYTHTPNCPSYTGRNQ